MKRSGFTLIEVIAAVVIIGIGIVPLLIERSGSLRDAQRSIRLQEAMRMAEDRMNEILRRGYAYFEAGGYLEGDESFTVNATFAAEEILIADFFPAEPVTDEAQAAASAAAEEEPETIVVYHITVQVTDRDDADISVLLVLDVPADLFAIEGTESLLPAEDKEATDAP